MRTTMSECLGWGVLHQIFGREVRHTIKKIRHLYVHVSLELNVIDTKLIISAKRGGLSDLVAPYNSGQIGLTITKMGVITVEPSYYA